MVDIKVPLVCDVTQLNIYCLVIVNLVQKCMEFIKGFLVA